MAVRRRSNLVRVKQARTMTWFGIDLGATVVADASQLIGSLNAAALAFRPFTVVRTRLIMQYASDQAAASESPGGALGFIVASDEAIATGAGALPDPVDDANAPWFVWDPGQCNFLFGDGTGFLEPDGRMNVIDSKAMRKVGANEDVAIIFEEVNNFGMNLTLIGRMLVKLH